VALEDLLAAFCQLLLKDGNYCYKLSLVDDDPSMDTLNAKLEYENFKLVSSLSPVSTYFLKVNNPPTYLKFGAVNSYFKAFIQDDTSSNYEQPLLIFETEVEKFISIEKNGKV
jgi:hypothetical protein